ncbi:Signal transduction histidine kinase [Cyclonatronum proteinivorum]|uniref:histidine kinase n=1 Tax=Cyclonatronum proteinivorum TaxID=1457365 RepID=A0A345UL65_9BACT|nr:sensor histidine kinase [Cyclonatronum proteinivorum]AXJ01217.1 Signal transduction histidine kinase [Cyclonatronum proteinivorum]
MRNNHLTKHNGDEQLRCRFSVLINRHKMFGNMFKLAVWGVMLLLIGVAAGYSKVNATGIQAGSESLFGTSQQAQLLIQNWMVGDGLPVNAVVDINQCNRGFIWFTTYEGIVRYDGVEFRTYNTSEYPEINTNRFTWIKADPFDPEVMWFVTEYGGMLKMKNGVFTFFNEENGFTDAKSSTPFAWDGKLMFATENGLFYYDHAQEAMRPFVFPAMDEVNPYFTSYATDQFGSLYLTTLNEVIAINPQRDVLKFDVPGYHPDRSRLLSYRGSVILYVIPSLYYINAETFEKVEVNDQHDTFNGLGIMVGDDRLFINSSSGISVFGKDATLNLNEQFFVEDLSAAGLLRYQPFKIGDTWFFPTNKGKMITANGVHFNVIDRNEYPLLQNVTKSFQDKDGNIWLASLFNGLIRVSDALVYSIRTRDEAGDDRLMGIYEDSRGDIWMSTRRGQIYRKQENMQPQPFPLLPGRNPLMDVYVFASDADGTLYAGVNRFGIAKQRPDGYFEWLSTDLHQDVLEIRALHIADDQTMWVGLLSGLRKLRNGVSVSYACQDQMSRAFVQQIKADGEGGLWIATLRAGLFYLNDSTGDCKHYTTRDGLGNNSVRGIYLDRYDTGTVWIATEGGGLTRYKNTELKTVNASMGLFRDLLHNVTEDFRGRLWMSTNHGIFFVYKEDVNQLLDDDKLRIRSTVFTERQGLANSEGNGGFQSSFILRDNGQLFFATQMGMAFFETNEIESERVSPIPIIDLFTSEGVVSQFPDKLVLPAGDDDFMINYTSIAFNAPDAVRFWYKLEGYEDRWTAAGNRRITSYTNLPPKTYQFVLTATDPLDPQFTQAAQTRLIITIQPHFYQTWWFRTVLACMLVLVLYSGYHYRIGAYERQERLLTRKVDERTSELLAEKEAALKQQRLIAMQANDLKQLNEVKDRFFSIIAHDLRGPFMGIRGLIELIRDHREELDDEKYEEVLDLLHSSAENHSKLLDNLLNWARIQLNQVKVTPAETNVRQVMQAAAASWELPAQSKSLRFNMQLSDFQLTTDQNMIITILRNLISNAVKFSWPDSEIILKTYKDDRTAVFEIQDFGTGMSEKQLRKLFTLEKEVSHKGTSEETGTGLGLVLVSDMVKMLNGTIEVKSKKGIGTLFRVKIPLIEPEITAGEAEQS